MMQSLPALLIVVFSLIFASIDLSANDRVSPYFTDNDRYLTVRGATIRIREEGPKAAIPIILLHGFTFSLESWDAWSDALKSDYRVIRYDLLGHGLTGPDPEQRYAPLERANFIGEVMDVLGIEKAIIGGNSLGGLAAWRFAARNPGRVEKLILVAPGGFSINGVTDKPVAPPEPVEAFFKSPSRPAIAFTLSRLFADQSLVSEARVDLMEYMMRRPGNGDAFLQSIGEFTLPEPTAELQSIKTPTLILWGEKDQTIPADHAALFNAAIPKAVLIEYQDAAHLPHEDVAKRSSMDLMAFLNGCCPTKAN